MSEDLSERFSEFGADDFVVVDEQLREEHLVGLSPDVGRCFPVHPFAVRSEHEGVFEGASDLLEPQLGRPESPLGLIDLRGDALLLFFEKLDWDGAGVVGAKQGSLFVFQSR